MVSSNSSEDHDQEIEDSDDRSRSSHEMPLAGTQEGAPAEPDSGPRLDPNSSDDHDQDAFGELYAQYAPRIFDYLARVVRNRDDAEDLLQATFLRAYEKRGTLRDPGKIKGWLFMIAHNQAMNYFRTSRRESPADIVTSFPELKSTSVTPEAGTEAAEAAEIVWSAASSLNPRQYEVMDLTVRQGLSTSEVAEVLGIRASHAAVLVHRARESLTGAVRDLLVIRNRARCDKLAGLVPGPVRSLSTTQRASVDQHLRYCTQCKRLSDELSSPEAVLAGIAPFALPHHLAAGTGGWQLIASKGLPQPKNAIFKGTTFTHADTRNHPTRRIAHHFVHRIGSLWKIRAIVSLVIVAAIAAGAGFMIDNSLHGGSVSGASHNQIADRQSSILFKKHPGVSIQSGGSPPAYSHSSDNVLVIVDAPSGGTVGPSGPSIHEVMLETVNTVTGKVNMVTNFGPGRSLRGEIFPDGNHALVIIGSQNDAQEPAGASSVYVVNLADGKVQAVSGIPPAPLWDYYFAFPVVGEDAVGLAGPIFTGPTPLEGGVVQVPNGNVWTISPSGLSTKIWSWSPATFSTFPNFTQAAGAYSTLSVQPDYYLPQRDTIYMSVTPGYTYPKHPAYVSAEFAESHGTLQQILPAGSTVQSVALLHNGTLAYVSPAQGSQQGGGPSARSAPTIGLHIGRSIPSSQILSTVAHQMIVMPGPGAGSVTVGMETGPNDWKFSVVNPSSATPSLVSLADFAHDMSPNGVWSPAGSVFVTGIVPVTPAGTPTDLVAVTRSGQVHRLATYPPYTVLDVLGFTQA
ncbi:MAG: RNA polymerase sigma factor [Actinobacteria bacterium]|jgi:RNA polymerase sigma factor (sigma-70 family)|nr:RNA polymerase sigma factor [Actinomycetota bacterium]